MGNVLWSWVGVGFNILIGFFLSPYIIYKLGVDGYGVWVLLSSLIGYYGLLDLGFKSALVRYSAHFNATGEPNKINEFVSTILFYYTLCSFFLLAVSLLLSRYAHRLFHIAPAYQKDFSILVILIGFNFLVGMNIFSGVLEGLQRFDISIKAYVASLAIRSIGTLALLGLGYGLVALGVNLIFAQVVTLLVCAYGLKRVFPALRLSTKLVKKSVLKQTASYGMHTFVANVAAQSLLEGVAIIIALFRPAAYVGYYFLPSRLLQYTLDLVERVGSVSTSSASDLAARDKSDAILRLGIYTNRYSFTLFTPLAIFLLIYGRELLETWVGHAFAVYSAPILPILLAGNAIAVAGQFNSGAILFGMAKHKDYARGLGAEALANFALLLLVVPRFGILGAAVVTSTLMILVRGLYTPWLVCRQLNLGLGKYLGSIFLRPTLTAIPVVLLLQWWKLAGPRMHGWAELILAAVLAALLYLGAAFYTCLEAEHQKVLLARLTGKWQNQAG